ncbi:MAG: hypothetical protein RMK20_10080, partial [Verrucomicrobiales bacterium]|nr:hypothetical protein [Verrucomicrobiales bacterium]
DEPRATGDQKIHAGTVASRAVRVEPPRAERGASKRGAWERGSVAHIGNLPFRRLAVGEAKAPRPTLKTLNFEP